MNFRTTALVCAIAASASLALPAHSQSSLTIYGRVDLGLFIQQGGTTPINGGRAGNPFGDSTELKQGSAGRLGFRGTEDLGGGWYSGFTMEHRFQPDTATPEVPFWQARSFVEIGSKTFGSVYLGREYIPAFWVALKLDPWGFDSVGTPGPKHQFANYTVDGGIRSNNTVGYKTPLWNGFQANLAVSAGEKLRHDSWGANLEYTNGPWYVAAAIDKTDEKQKLSMVGVAYDFDIIRVALTRSLATVAGNKNRNTTLTGRIPVGPGVIKLSLAKLELGPLKDSNTRFGIGYEHFLSKRTSILGNIGSAKQDRLTRTTLYDLTLKHNF